MESKEMFDGKPTALDISLYKKLGFYQILDSKGQRIFGYQVCSSILKTFLLIVQFITIFGVLGFFINPDHVNSYHRSNTFELIVIFTNCTLSSLKMYTLVINADTIWKLFNLMCTDFLQCSRISRDIRADLEKRCRRPTTITSLIVCSFLFGMVLWIMGPFVTKEVRSESLNNAERRYQNVINAKFPVTVKFYNKYYFVFYLMEVTIGFCIVYGSILVDAFLMSFCWIISAQYQAVKSAFEQFGYDNLPKKNNKTEMYDDLKSIIINHQNVYLKMKSFYSVVWPITLIHVFSYSCSLTTYAYVIITILYSKETITIDSEIIKIALTVSNIIVELYTYCYLLELVDEKKEAVNFGIYSCNWTEMDIRLKKLLLLSLKINNANTLKLKGSPKIAIDRPFFGNVIRTCFNIVSVLIQTRSNSSVQ